MSSIVTDRGVVHYEAYGRGRPVILLHCWLGSWSYWLSTMEALSSTHKTYALDFWGFGESGTRGEHFRVSDYVEMVVQFMDRLGLRRAPVMGHSMGGTVSLSLALAHPDRVQKVTVVGSPIVGDGLALMLRLASKKILAALAYKLPGMLPLGVRLSSPFLTRDWRTWYRMFEKDLSRTTMKSFHYSIASLRETDLRPRLREIRVPVLGIYGRNDRIVNPNQGELLARGAMPARVAYFEHSGHFPMLDEPDRFHRALRDFLDR
ncbi:MAG TPA: alpha/beta hydrolase [Anaerolineales bacterium]|nr:alpha/beta hydrolase [Anaerolineae bacterium]HIQ02043.1 alpha/beta hydrolase [Anaerolineales bacterium]